MVLVWLSVVLKPPDDNELPFCVENGLQLATVAVGAPGSDAEITQAVYLGGNRREEVNTSVFLSG